MNNTQAAHKQQTETGDTQTINIIEEEEEQQQQQQQQEQMNNTHTAH